MNNHPTDFQIRNELGDEKLSRPIPKYLEPKFFLGKFQGVMLTRKGKTNACVDFILIDKRCNVWSTQHKAADVYWLPSCQMAIQAALDWLKHNATKAEWGWKFK